MAQQIQQYISSSVQDTQNFALSFAKGLTGGEILLLDGEMGAGKTHFAKGLALGLGVTDTVTSPTFAIHNSYQGTKLILNHFDFYRITDSREAEMLGLAEFFGDQNSVAAIEWWQNIQPLIGRKYIKITLQKQTDNQRLITVWEEK